MDAVKLMMTWDILPGREEDYFEFHIRKFIPTMEQLGVTLSEAWLTVYADINSDMPRLLAEAVIPSRKTAQKMLRSKEWRELGDQLDDFVENFTYKLVPARTRWQF